MGKEIPSKFSGFFLGDNNFVVSLFSMALRLVFFGCYRRLMMFYGTGLERHWFLKMMQ